MPGTVTVLLPVETSVASMTTLNSAYRVADLRRSLELATG